MAKTSNESTEAVLGYLKGTNRPYSVNDIVNNLQNKFSKAIVTKAVESLAEEGEIVEKLNGKQKLYFYSQSKIQLDENKLKEVDEKLRTSDNQLKTLKSWKTVLESKLKLLKQHIPIENLEKSLAEMRSTIEELRAKSEQLTIRCKDIDPEKQNDIKKRRQIYVGEWRRRKRLANEMFGQIHENVSKPKKALLEEIGVETDEDVDVRLPSQ